VNNLSKLNRKFTSFIIIMVIALLTACGNQEEKIQGTNNSKRESNQSIQKEAKQLKENATKFEKIVNEEKEKDIVKSGNELNEDWLSFENKVRDTYPLLYTDIEKYLQPIAIEVSKEKPNMDKVKENISPLIDSISQLEAAKENSLKKSEELSKAVEDYKAYVNVQADQLVTTTKKFTTAVKANDLEQAKKLYPEARTYYERIEPIAESFGELDPAIDARENDVDAKSWSGFHKIEKGLWVNKSTEGLSEVATQLNKDVRELQKEIKNVQLDPTQIVAGSMELLNEAAISKVTGEEERYSKMDLVDLAANVEGSEAVYHAILPALTSRNKELAQKIDDQFLSMKETLSKFQQNDVYIPYDQLSNEDVRSISQELSLLSELMAQTAVIFQ
jgi:iron uptake system component EfeO